MVWSSIGCCVGTSGTLEETYGLQYNGQTSAFGEIVSGKISTSAKNAVELTAKLLIHPSAPCQLPELTKNINTQEEYTTFLALSLLRNYVVFIMVSEIFTAVLRHDDNVLDTHPAPLWVIESRLNAHDMPRFKDGR